MRQTAAAVLLGVLVGCGGQTSASSAADAGADAAAGSDSANVIQEGSFVCSPPANASRAPVTFMGTVFDDARGCLVGAPVTLPVCGCFNGIGHDSSTWCFAAPGGATYFGVSADGCTVQMPPGWYATQSFGSSPFGTPTSAQSAACAGLRAASTARGSYDMPGPPPCPSDGGAADSGDGQGE